LKLHIEVLQEKIDELELERESFQTKLLEEKKIIESKLKEGFARLID